MKRKILNTSITILLITMCCITFLNAQENIATKDNKATVSQNIGNNSVQENITNENDTENHEAMSNSMGETEKFSLWKMFQQGGPFMWPILLLSAFGFGFAIERFIFFKKSRLASREFIDFLEKTIAEKDIEYIEKVCKENKNKLTSIIEKGLSLKDLGYERVEKTLSVAASVEVASLERFLAIILAIANIAPMLGFLGTVTGMVTAFNDIAAADQVSAKIVAGGIREALLTTVFGLMASIPLLVIYNYFVSKIEGFVTSVERISTDIIEKMIKTGYLENNHK